jgi:hypothetical protein
LEQLDVRKQAGQWARLYKQVKAAEDHLRQAEQTSPSPAQPPETAKQAEVHSSDEDAASPLEKNPETGELKERLRAVAGDLMYWKGGLKVLKQAR